MYSRKKLGKAKNRPWEKNIRSRRFKPFREMKQRFFVICEGKTEKNYFDGFKLTSAKVKTTDKKGKNALTLLNEALTAKELNKDYDQYWMVFDRDEQTNSFDQIIEVFNKAGQNSLNIAFSNQCFELWYLLHFQDITTPIEAKQLLKKLDKFLPDPKGRKYSKNDNSHYERLLAFRSKALKRAQKLSYNVDIHLLAKTNPSTTVNRLVGELIKYIDIDEEAK